MGPVMGPVMGPKGSKRTYRGVGDGGSGGGLPNAEAHVENAAPAPFGVWGPAASSGCHLAGADALKLTLFYRNVDPSAGGRFRLLARR